VSFVGPAQSQYSIAGPDYDAPHIMCKAYKVGTNDVWASGEAPNQKESGARFEYYAKQYDEDLRTDCQRFTNIDPDYRKSFEPGGSYQGSFGDTFTLIQAPFLPDNWSTTPTPEEKKQATAEKKPAKSAAEKSDTAEASSEPPKKSAAQVAVEEAAARRAEREAEFQAKRAEYERKLAEQQKQVEDFKRAQEEVERTKAANQAKADEAAAKFKAEQEAYAESVRHNEAQQEAAKKLMADWDARHGLKAKASTDTDANQCVTQAGTQLNASFKGNTAASIINGCGQPVDVRICLMTSTKGWNCGVGYGVGSQEKWSWSSFDATGPVFVDARISSSSRPLASPR
jgi:hypothetical protein